MTNLRGFETPEKEAGSSTNKIYAASIVAGAIGAFVVVSLATGMWNSPPAQKASFHVASNDVGPLPPATPAVEMGTPTLVAPPPVAQAPVEMAPVLPVRHAPPVRAARTYVRAPVVLPPDENSPVAAPLTSPDIAPPPAPTQSSPVLTAPVQPAPEPTPPVQPQP
jgi:hypothetical protein